ncbi:MAG: hypothetical protein OXM61_17145 [Candidatus Poribacteria bacterium]|nr:hypothetical protein [Candidatus Poribacteria bacterium]
MCFTLALYGIASGKLRQNHKSNTHLCLYAWEIAVEYHGRQHFEPVEFFGGKEAFHKTVGRDKRKATLAKNHSVKLLIVTETDNQDDIVRDINDILNKRKVLPP